MVAGQGFVVFMLLNSSTRKVKMQRTIYKTWNMLMFRLFDYGNGIRDPELL